MSLTTPVPRPFSAAASGSDGRPHVSGPISGCGHDSGTLYPEMRLSSKADAEAAARIANEAFAYGVSWARAQMREALGIAGR